MNYFIEDPDITYTNTKGGSTPSKKWPDPVNIVGQFGFDGKGKGTKSRIFDVQYGSYMANDMRLKQAWLVGGHLLLSFVHGGVTWRHVFPFFANKNGRVGAVVKLDTWCAYLNGERGTLTDGDINTSSGKQGSWCRIACGYVGRQNMQTPKRRLHEDTETTIPSAPKKPKSSSKSKYDARIADFEIEEEATRERAERGHKAKKRKLLEDQLLIIAELRALDDDDVDNDVMRFKI